MQTAHFTFTAPATGHSDRQGIPEAVAPPAADAEAMNFAAFFFGQLGATNPRSNADGGVFVASQDLEDGEAVPLMSAADEVAPPTRAGVDPTDAEPEEMALARISSTRPTHMGESAELGTLDVDARPTGQLEGVSDDLTTPPVPRISDRPTGGMPDQPAAPDPVLDTSQTLPTEGGEPQPVRPDPRLSVDGEVTTPVPDRSIARTAVEHTYNGPRPSEPQMAVPEMSTSPLARVSSASIPHIAMAVMGNLNTGTPSTAASASAMIPIGDSIDTINGLQLASSESAAPAQHFAPVRAIPMPAAVAGTGNGTSQEPQIVAATPSGMQNPTAGQSQPVFVETAHPVQQQPAVTPNFITQAPVSPLAIATAPNVAAIPVIATDRDLAVNFDADGPMTALDGPSIVDRSATASAAQTQTRTLGAAPTAIVQSVGQQLAAAVTSRPGGVTELVLNPAELGRVELRMVTNETGVIVQITMERPETQDLVRRHLESFANEFRQFGFRDVGFEFQGDRGGNAQEAVEDGQTQAALDENGEGNPEPALVQRPSIPIGGLDLRV